MLHGFTRRHTKLTMAVLLGLAACGFVCFRGSFAGRERTLDASPQPKSIAEDQVRLLIAQAAQLRTAGHYTQAAPLLDEALALAESSSGPDSVTTATVLNQLGMLDKYTGRFDEGERVYRRALKIVEQKLGPLDPLRADLYHNLGGINHARGRYAEGEPFARLAVEIRERSLGPDHPDTAADIAALAALMDGQGKYEEAEQLYLRSLAVFERVYGSENFDVAVNLNNLAALYYARGNIKEAELRYRRRSYQREITRPRPSGRGDDTQQSRCPLQSAAALLRGCLALPPRPADLRARTGPRAPASEDLSCELRKVIA